MISSNPFRSIGWAQDDLFSVLAKKILTQGYSGENISSLITAASTGGISPDSLHIEQQFALNAQLKTTDSKYIAIEEAKKLVTAELPKLTPLKKYDSKRYSIKENINHFCAMILILSISLAEPEDAIEYFYKHSQERDLEIMLYEMLDIAALMRENEIWLKIYRDGIKRKIKPRDYLKKEYKIRNGEE